MCRCLAVAAWVLALALDSVESGVGVTRADARGSDRVGVGVRSTALVLLSALSVRVDIGVGVGRRRCG